jgi:hypothetical protein
MLVDNTKSIKEFLENNLAESSLNKEFYKFDIMVRKKDNPNNIFILNHNGSFLIHSWLISSVEQFNKYLPEMKKLCDLTGARMYMLLDKKSTKSMAIQLADYGLNLLKTLTRENNISTKNVFNVMNSLTSRKELSIHQSRKLLFDIDNTSTDKLGEVIYGIKPEDAGHFYALKSPNGWHVITNRFNKENIPKSILEDTEIDIKENAMTVVYFNG